MRIFRQYICDFPNFPYGFLNILTKVNFNQRHIRIVINLDTLAMKIFLGIEQFKVVGEASNKLIQGDPKWCFFEFLYIKLLVTNKWQEVKKKYDIKMKEDRILCNDFFFNYNMLFIHITRLMYCQILHLSLHSSLIINFVKNLQKWTYLRHFCVVVLLEI